MLAKYWKLIFGYLLTQGVWAAGNFYFRFWKITVPLTLVWSIFTTPAASLFITNGKVQRDLSIQVNPRDFQTSGYSTVITNNGERAYAGDVTAVCTITETIYLDGKLAGIYEFDGRGSINIGTLKPGESVKRYIDYNNIDQDQMLSGDANFTITNCKLWASWWFTGETMKPFHWTMVTPYGVGMHAAGHYLQLDIPDHTIGAETGNEAPQILNEFEKRDVCDARNHLGGVLMPPASPAAIASVVCHEPSASEMEDKTYADPAPSHEQKACNQHMSCNGGKCVDECD